ncbi:hypothetical protein BHE90_012511 [Fusarium euwallaceae]|uniref:DNA2/NAM7 helicase-like C-terminal domain-containing protein n=2 Tax=Fusarium solani species complex TaxID=232080 RepID=A0A3M2RRQ5_9HYPO|nr:hypothetical protein CDV36_012469 [Fusarium kuroshium]RTE73057.1 hypothetical protein BHE90_012511 [Fusarium euwallaceae]
MLEKPNSPGALMILTSTNSLSLLLVKQGLENAEAYVGLCLSVPRDANTKVRAWYSSSLRMVPSRTLEIICKFPNQNFTISHRPLSDAESKNLEYAFPSRKATEFCIVSVNLSCDPTVTGFGIPFHGENQTIDGWINEDAPIQGTIKLTQLLQQRSFMLLVQATEEQAEDFFDITASSFKPFHYGYGNNHAWDMNRYNHQIPRNRGKGFSPRVHYDDFNQRDTALTQMHKVGDEPATTTERFVCLLEPEGIFDPKHWRATRRALKGDFAPARVEFNELIEDPDDSREPRNVTWTVVQLTYASDLMRQVDLTNRIALGLRRPASGKDRKYTPEASKDYESALDTKRIPLKLICESGIANERKRIDAVNRLSRLGTWPTVMANDTLSKGKRAALNDILIGQGLWRVWKDTSSFRFPHFDVFDGVTAEVRDACLTHVFEDDRERAQEYFSKLHFGIGLVSAAPGMGKSHLASILITLLCLNPSIRKLYVSAASNVATDNILLRSSNIAESTVSTLAGAGYPVKRLMLVRGYNGKMERENCLKALVGTPFEEIGIWNSSPWRFEHSLCWWTLRALGSKAAPPLTSHDCAELWSLHQHLGALVSPNPKVFHRDFTDFIPLVRVARGLMTPEEYLERYTKSVQNRSLTDLMEHVISCANVVATTPAASSYDPYLTFNSKMAKAVVFDEAGTLFRADGLLVFGNTPRPMIAVGDPKQLAPVLATAIERLDVRRADRHRDRHRDHHDLPTNRFVGEAEISWLSWFMHLGIPVFHLHTQHRMAKGLFDIMLEASYDDIKPYFKYSPICRPIDFPLGIKVEQYVKIKHHLPSGSPDSLLPVFFNTLNCPCRNYPDNPSRLNPRQADCIEKYLEPMMKELSIQPADVAVLTPYRANMRTLQKRFRKDQVLKEVVCTTIDSFQGREAQIIVVALCVTEETGPSFAADPRRLNVALTRHKSALFIFGDINTIRKSSYNHEDVSKSKEGKTLLDPNTMDRVFQMIRASRRIVNLEGDPDVDPDRYWKRFRKFSKFP